MERMQRTERMTPLERMMPLGCMRALWRIGRMGSP
jgi:hypothetical protein